MRKKKLSETELAEKFILWFNEYEVYKEIPFGGYLDFMAVKEHIRIGVEVKCTFGLTVIEQAVNKRDCAHYMYIAVPVAKSVSRHFGYQICEQFGIGVLEYYEDRFNTLAQANEPEELRDFNQVVERVRPKLNRHVVKIDLPNYLKRNKAGVVSERITPYKNTIKEILYRLRRNKHKMDEGLDFKEMMKGVNYHYTTISSAQSTLMAHCRSGLIKEFKIERGRIYLTEEEKVEKKPKVTGTIRKRDKHGG